MTNIDKIIESKVLKIAEEYANTDYPDAEEELFEAIVGICNEAIATERERLKKIVREWGAKEEKETKEAAERGLFRTPGTLQDLLEELDK